MDLLTIFHKRLQQYDHTYPNLRKQLSKNPNITLQMVLEDIKRNPSKRNQWNPRLLSCYIPVKDLFAHGFDLSEDPDELSLFGRVDIETIINTPSYPWNWNELSMNKHITLDDIAAHPELPWNYRTMLYNRNFKLHPIVFEHLTPGTYENLSRKATLEQLEQRPDIPWTHACLESPFIKDKQKLKELFEKHDRLFSKHYISRNPNPNFQDLYELFGTDPDFFQYASLNPNITLQDFLNYPNEKWDFTSLSRVLPIEYMIQHPEYEWDWSIVMYYNRTITHANLTKEIYEHMKEYHIKFHRITFYWYGYYAIFVNRNVPWYDKKCIFEDLMVSNEYEAGYLANLSFFLEPTFQEIREYFAGKKIIRHIVEYISNPKYEQCRKRLKREHEKMNEFICV